MIGNTGDTFGCWCFMPFAARYKWKNCWLWEENITLYNAWKEELNGDSEEFLGAAERR